MAKLKAMFLKKVIYLMF